MIEARHAGHVHSQDHSRTALLFLALVFSVLILYSCFCLLYGRVKPRRHLNWPCPPWAVAGAWVVFCTVAYIRHHDFDSITWLARRGGRLAFAVAVFGQFLVLKPAVLPRTYVTGLTFCHKWTGRTAVLLAAFHGILYTIAHARIGTFSTLFTNTDNLWGIFALGCYTIIGITSLRFIRRRWYSLFFIPHAPLAFLSTVLIVFHSRPSASNLAEMAFFLFVLAIIFRLSIARSTTATVVPISPNYDLVSLERKALPSQFQPGSHLRLSSKLTKPMAWIGPTHPYTIASLDSDLNIKLVVKRTRWQIISGDSYSCQGPFNISYDPLSYSKVIAIGGGAGISLVAPLWKITRDANDTQLKAVWITRSSQDIGILGHIGVDACDVYITGSNEEASLDSPDASAFELDDIEPEGDNAQLLNKSEGLPLGENIAQFKGRPPFDDIFSGFIQDTPAADVSIVACGPESLIHDLKAWSKLRNYHFFAEEYST